MNSKQVSDLGKPLHDTLRHLAVARAEIIAAEALLHPLVTEGEAPELPAGIAADILEMYDHAGEAHSMIDYAEHDWQRIEKQRAALLSGGQQELFPNEQNGTGKQRVHIVGGVSDDQPDEHVDL